MEEEEEQRRKSTLLEGMKQAIDSIGFGHHKNHSELWKTSAAVDDHLAAKKLHLADAGAAAKNFSGLSTSASGAGSTTSVSPVSFAPKFGPTF